MYLCYKIDIVTDGCTIAMFITFESSAIVVYAYTPLHIIPFKIRSVLIVILITKSCHTVAYFMTT